LFYLFSCAKVKNMKTNPHIQEAVDFFGSQVSLARKLGCNPTFIHQLLHGVKTPSPKMALAIESATEKKVTRKVLRPSDWFDIWPELRS
jgi:DNA-binding transcriptional regulator YdaS (Cro superfamily)